VAASTGDRLAVAASAAVKANIAARSESDRVLGDESAS